MSESFEKAAEEAAAFQKICLETMSKMMQAAFTFTPNSPPPEVVRQIRSGIFQALAGSWEEFMRSPQFLDGMKQWMENAIAFRKLTNEFMGRVRNEMQAPARSDIDTILLSVRHMEQRLLDRIDELGEEVRVLKAQAPARNQGQRRREPGRVRTTSKRAPANGKATKP